MLLRDSEYGMDSPTFAYEELSSVSISVRAGHVASYRWVRGALLRDSWLRSPHYGDGDFPWVSGGSPVRLLVFRRLESIITCFFS